MARDRRRRRQGFDPLASLFESTLSETVRPGPLPDDGDTTLSSLPPAIDVTDPVFSPPSTPTSPVSEPEQNATVLDEPTLEAEPGAQPVVTEESTDLYVQPPRAPEELSVPLPLPRIEATLSERAVRPKTAAQVLAELRVHSSAQAAVEAREVPLEERVEGVLSVALPGLENIYIAEVEEDFDLSEIVATYTSHAERFMAEGRMAAAVAARSVATGLDGAGAHRFAMASIRTDASHYLVWVDLYASTVLACFPDAMDRGLI